MWPLLGTLGLVAIEGSYLPQIFRLFRLKESRDVSVFFPSLNFAGRLLALSYSLSKGEAVFGVGFAVGCVLRLTLLLQVLAYRPRAARLPELAGATQPGGTS